MKQGFGKYFIEQPEAQLNNFSIAEDISHAVNMKLLSMKVPMHLRLIKLHHNEHDYLTGPTVAETTAKYNFTSIQGEFFTDSFKI